MAEYISISEVKDLLAECPICTEHFDDTTRVPRRMPCCVQSICQPCLEIFSKGRQSLSCPMCRHQHHLPDGIKSLPKEVIVLRMLEHIKIQKGIMPPCTDCPDNETASSRCEDCGAYLCQECKRAHFRHVTSRHHKVISLKEMKDRPVESVHRQHQCKDHNQPQQFYCNTCEKVVCVGCTVVEHKEGKGHDVVTIDEAHAKMTASVKHNVKQLEEKSHMLQKNVKSLTKKAVDFETSGNAARELINTSFDSLIDEIQKRRSTVLSGLKKDTSKHVRENQINLESTSALLAKITSAIDNIKLMQGNQKRQCQRVFSDQISAETDSIGRYEGKFVMKTSRMDH